MLEPAPLAATPVEIEPSVVEASASPRLRTAPRGGKKFPPVCKTLFVNVLFAVADGDLFDYEEKKKDEEEAEKAEGKEASESE